jgi:gamma-glutamylcyclotransferase (GGCT)/AIG2-like uncharacterized protein YtfP
MSEMFLFVYGTLRPDLKGAKLQDCVRGIAPATAIGVELHGTKWYPALKHSDNLSSIAKGYLVEVLDLPSLDAYEGNGQLFNREPVTVRLESGEEREVVAYFYLGDVNGWPVIEDWRP